jgi:hypothetical protein
MKFRITYALAAAALFSACDDDVDPVQPQPEVPTTYTFANVDYSGQTARIQLLDSLEMYGKAGTTTDITYSDLEAIYQNTSQLFGTTKNIKEKTVTDFQDEVDALFVELDNLSNDDVRDSNRKGDYLVANDGREPVQILIKGLMGALLYNQATAVYLGEDKMDVDNTTVVEGKGTAMQHHWDEAFGYFGAPANFPANEGAGGMYWASYAQKRASVFDVRQEIMNAFIAGRHAINQNDMAARDEAIATIRTNWEKLVAANVVHYINGVIAELPAEAETIDMAQSAKLYHAWSEAKGFAYGLKYSPENSTISDAQVTELMNNLGASPTTTTRAKLQDANALLQQVYGFTAQQMSQL